MVGGAQLAYLRSSLIKYVTRTTIFVRQNPVLESGDHTFFRTGSISLQLDSKSLRLEEVQPAKCWNDMTALLSFARSAMADATEHSFTATFKLRILSAPSINSIYITVDTKSPWWSCVKVDARWQVESRNWDLPLLIQRRFRSLIWAPGQPEVEVDLQRCIIDRESRVALAIRTISVES